MSASVRNRPICRLSPNEEAAALHKRREERRKARLLQVRQQEKEFAKTLREEVKSKKEAERKVIEEHLEAALTASHEAELRELESRYLSRMGQIGKGHSDAQHISQEQNRMQELRLLLEAEQRWRAQERHISAMKELTNSKLAAMQAQQQSLRSRRKAMEIERERAKHVATSKPHATQPLIMDLVVGKGHRVQLKEAEGYASTYYHIPKTVVQKVSTPELNKPNATEIAQAKIKEDEIIQRHFVVSQQEQLEKARLRHKHAMAKVKLEKEKEDVLTQLKMLERQDRAHRQKSFAKIPVNLFQPAHRRSEIVSEQERDMEQAFEKLFVGTHGASIHAHQTLSDIATEPASSGYVLEELESSQDSEQPRKTSTDESSKPREHPPVPSPLLHVDHHHEPMLEPASELPLKGRSRSPILMPHADPSIPRPHSHVHVGASPDLYDSSYTSPSLTTPTGLTSSSSSSPEPAGRSHVFQDSTTQQHPLQPHQATAHGDHTQDSEGSSNYTSDDSVHRPPPAPSVSAPHSIPYTSAQIPARPKPPNSSENFASRKPTVKFSLAPTVFSSSDGASQYIPSIQQSSHSMVGTYSQESRGVSSSLPQRPDLSVTMTTSFNNQESPCSFLDTSSSTSSGESKPTSMTPGHILQGVPEKRGDGMHKLMSMIRTQHEAWNRRLVARSNTLSSQRMSTSSSSSSSSTTTSHPLSQVHSATQNNISDDDATKAHHDSLSVFTLSTRESVASLQDSKQSTCKRTPNNHPPLPHQGEKPLLPHTLDNDSSTTTSPEPLSISPYHTTLEMSTAISPNTSTNKHSPLREHEDEMPQRRVVSEAQEEATTPEAGSHDNLPTHTSLQQGSLPTSVGHSVTLLHSSEPQYPHTAAVSKHQPTNNLGNSLTQSEPPNLSITTLSDQVDERQQHPITTIDSTLPSIAHPAFFTQRPEQSKEQLQSQNTTGSSLHIENIESLESQITTQPLQPSLSPLHEYREPQYHPSITTMPSVSYLELPSHLTMMDRPLPTTTVEGGVMLTPSDLDLTATSHPHSPLQSPHSTVSHSTPSHSRSSSPQLLSPYTPMSPVIREPSHSKIDDVVTLGAGDVSEHLDDAGEMLAQEPLRVVSSQENKQTQRPQHSEEHQAERNKTPKLKSTPLPLSVTSTEHPNLKAVVGNNSAPSSSTSLSLQEAFLKKKEEFVQKSRARLQQLKTAAQKRQTETKPVFAAKQNLPMKKKVKTPKKTTAQENVVDSSPGSQGDSTKKKAVSFSNQLFQLQESKPQGAKQPLILSSQKREKIHKKEIKERNLRFYNRLPEVKRKFEEEKRHQAYTANRERAKQYHQKLRSMSKSKRQDSKKSELSEHDKKQSRKLPFR